MSEAPFEHHLTTFIIIINNFHSPSTPLELHSPGNSSFFSSSTTKLGTTILLFLLLPPLFLPTHQTKSHNKQHTPMVSSFLTTFPLFFPMIY